MGFKAINVNDIIGEIFESNNYEKVKVLEYAGEKKKYKHYYKVKFLKSGNILEKERHYIKIGNIADDVTKDIIGNIYTNISGYKYKVLNFSHKNNDNIFFDVKFIDSKHETVASKSHIKNGEVKDRLSGINNYGSLGNAKYKDNKRGYFHWKSMLLRCYNQNSDGYKYYGQKGVTVCKRWHRFDYFIEDIPNIDGYDEEKFKNGVLELDKDKKQISIPINKRIYSKETCCWLTRSQNASLPKSNY